MTVLRCIEKPYVCVFYVLVKFFGDEWRAVLVMSLFQGILIGALVCGVALVTGHTPLLIPKLTLAVGTLFVYAITPYVFVRKARWHRYKAEFDRYSRAKSKMASVAVWCGFVLATYAGISVIKAAIH
jgi:hypothetical protein